MNLEMRKNNKEERSQLTKIKKEMEKHNWN